MDSPSQPELVTITATIVAAYVSNNSISSTDLPGLIEGAHEGKGLGHQFLKHAERTKILVHVIDMSGSEDRDPVDDFYKICEELDLYSEELLQKHRIIVANKMDLPDTKKNLTRFKRKVTKDIIPISAMEKEGLDKLLASIRLLL